MHQRCCYCHMKRVILWYTFLHEESVNVLWACWGLLGLVGTCQDLSGLVGTCREFVGTCWELWGGIGYVDFMESHFEGIAIVVNKILAEFPIPEILRSVPASKRVDP